MNKGTFGSVKQYKMLDFLTEKVSLMDEKNKNYISSVISDINNTVKKSELIDDIQIFHQLLEVKKTHYLVILIALQLLGVGIIHYVIQSILQLLGDL